MTKAETTLSIVVSLLSLLGIIFTVSFLVRGGANEGFLEYPVITALHVVPGLVYMALAPLQFVGRIRRKYPSYHRWSGRLLATAGLILGAAALFISLVFPYSGTAERLVVGAFSIFFLISIAKGVQSARASRYAEHREWMMRAFAIGLSIVTMRLIFIPILIAVGGASRDEAEFYSIVSFTIAFVVHSAFAELWIRHTRDPARIGVGERQATETLSCGTQAGPCCNQ